MSICTLLYQIALQLNFFINYKTNEENFRCRDLICTYVYIILCTITVVTYGIYYFTTETMMWNCEVLKNNKCNSDQLKGGGACCKFEKEHIYHKLIRFLGILGGIISSILLIIMVFLQISKIIEGKIPDSNPEGNRNLTYIHGRPYIDDLTTTEIESNPQISDIQVITNTLEITNASNNSNKRFQFLLRDKNN